MKRWQSAAFEDFVFVPTDECGVEHYAGHGCCPDSLRWKRMRHQDLSNPLVWVPILSGEKDARLSGYGLLSGRLLING